MQLVDACLMSPLLRTALCRHGIAHAVVGVTAAALLHSVTASHILVTRGRDTAVEVTWHRRFTTVTNASPPLPSQLSSTLVSSLPTLPSTPNGSVVQFLINVASIAVNVGLSRSLNTLMQSHWMSVTPTVAVTSKTLREVCHRYGKTKGNRTRHGNTDLLTVVQELEERTTGFPPLTVPFFYLPFISLSNGILDDSASDDSATAPAVLPSSIVVDDAVVGPEGSNNSIIISSDVVNANGVHSDERMRESVRSSVTALLDCMFATAFPSLQQSALSSERDALNDENADDSRIDAGGGDHFKNKPANVGTGCVADGVMAMKCEMAILQLLLAAFRLPSSSSSSALSLSSASSSSSSAVSVSSPLLRYCQSRYSVTSLIRIIVTECCINGYDNHSDGENTNAIEGMQTRMTSSSLSSPSSSSSSSSSSSTSSPESLLCLVRRVMWDERSYAATLLLVLFTALDL